MPEYTRMDWLERALADLPRAGVRARLKQELERRAAAMTTSTIEPTQANQRAPQEGQPESWGAHGGPADAASAVARRQRGGRNRLLHPRVRRARSDALRCRQQHPACGADD